jgi:tRNA (guanine-N7-)-methyltransferase
MTDNTDQPHRRPVRSFVRREGRLTEGQQRALDELYARYGLVVEPGKPLDLDAAFGRRAPRVLEIGFGNGESLAAQALRHPERDYLGIEVHRPGVGHLLLKLEETGIDNVRVICGDAQQIVSDGIEDGALHGVQLYFPDPWPKKRHHKRRIVQPEWVELVARKLQPGGFLHLATDWQDYAEHMLATLSASASFENCAGPGTYAPRPPDRPLTKFEARGQRLGHGVWDLLFLRR